MLHQGIRQAAVWVLFAWAAGGIAVAETPFYEPEVQRDAPAANKPREDPAARSAGTIVSVGPYVSVQVNIDSFGQNIVGDAANEPSMAVSPKNPDNLVIGWRQFDSINSDFRQAGMAYSFDAGQTWTYPGVILEPGVFRSDPVVAPDSGGNFYYQSLTNPPLRLKVFKTTDGGVSYLPGVDEFGGDKNWIAVDRTDGPGEGHAYGIWQRFGGACCGSNVFTRSTDGAASFESPVAVSRSPTFGTLAVGPDGEVYAAGINGSFTQNFNSFVVAKSTNAEDDGVTPTFSSVVVDMGGSMRSSGGPNPAGLLGQANVVVDNSDGPNRGFVYLVASINGPSLLDPLDVHFSRSEDGGASWTPIVIVNNDSPAPQHWQWLAAVDVNPDGRIDAVWYDTRNSNTSNISELFYAYSYDAGNTWQGNIPVSPSFDSHLGWPQQNKMGDYIQIVSDRVGGGVAYAATFNGEQDVYFLRVFPDCNANGFSDIEDIDSVTSLDCNLTLIPDECETAVTCIAAGAIPDQDSPTDDPLLLEKLAGDEVRLTWSPSCNPSDADYAVYEGPIGDFTEHEPRFCTTGGVAEKNLTPNSGAAYFLIAPNNGIREGSYGTDSDGAQRPPSDNFCLEPGVGACS